MAIPDHAQQRHGGNETDPQKGDAAKPAAGLFMHNTNIRVRGSRLAAIGADNVCHAAPLVPDPPSAPPRLRMGGRHKESASPPPVRRLGAYAAINLGAFLGFLIVKRI